MDVRSPSDRLVFEMRDDEVPVMRACRLGLEFTHHDLLTLGSSNASDVEVARDSYRLVGSDTPIEVTAHQRDFECVAAGHPLTLQVRVTDDAIGLRCRWGGATYRLLSDLTSFRFASPGRAWLSLEPGDGFSLWTP